MTQQKYLRLHKFICIIIICIFTFNNVVWASGDLFSSSAGKTTLQVPSFFNLSDTTRVETAISRYVKFLGIHIADEKLHLTPNVAGQKVDLFLDPDNVQDGILSLLCKVGDNEYVATVNLENASTLVPGSINIIKKLSKTQAPDMEVTEEASEDWEAGLNPKQSQALESARKMVEDNILIIDKYESFDLDSQKDKQVVIAIAKICAKQDGTHTLKNFQNFGLDASKEADKKVVIEIAKAFGSETSIYFQNFGLDASKEEDKQAVIAIAKECARRNGFQTARSFKNFGLYARKEEDKQAVIEVAKVCARQDGRNTAEFFKNFGLDVSKEEDKQAVIDVAKACARQDGGHTARLFKNFGLKALNEDDRQAVLEIAEECAKQDGGSTVVFFKEFGLDSIFGINRLRDFKEIMNIAKICYLNDKKKTISLFNNFGLEFKDRASFLNALTTIKDEDWSMVLRSTSEDYFPTQEDMMSIVFCGTSEERTQKAIEIKQRVYILYRQWRSMGKKLETYPIQIEKLELYTGTYKLPWKQFCKFMDENYDEFHNNPEKFIPKDTEVDLSEMPLPKPEATDMESEEIDELQKDLTPRQRKVFSEIKRRYEANWSIGEIYDELNFKGKKIKEKNLIIAMIKFYVKEDMKDVLRHFFDGGIEPPLDSNGMLEVAKFCVEQDANIVVEMFGRFGFHPQEDKEIIVELAKLCAIKAPFETARSFQNFELNHISDFAHILDIIDAFTSSDMDLVGRFISCFELKFKSTEGFIRAVEKVKGKDWAVILREIGPETGFVPDEADMWTLVVANEKQKTREAILLKRWVYIQSRIDIELIEHNLKDDQLHLYKGIYKLPWKAFCEFMDKSYDEFHQNPEKFMPKEPALDMANMQLPKPEATDMGLDKAQQQRYSDVMDKVKKIRADGKRIIDEYKNFNLDPAKKTDRPAVIEIAKLCGREGYRMPVVLFDGFGLDMSKVEDKQEVIEIAKICAKEDGWATAKFFKNFGLDPEEDKAEIVKIAIICANNVGIDCRPEYFSNFGLDPNLDKQSIINIAKLYAKQNGGATASFFKQFGLDGSNKEDKPSVIEIALECAKQEGTGTAKYFKNFGLDPMKDKEEIVKIAIKCAKQNGGGTASFFKQFGLDGSNKEDKSAVISIALECAKQDGAGTAKFFIKFGLDAIGDIADILDILYFCASNNSVAYKALSKSLGLKLNSNSFQQKKLGKGKDWFVVLKTIEKKILSSQSRDYLEHLSFKGKPIEDTHRALIIKQRVYIDNRSKKFSLSQIEPIRIKAKVLENYTGIYKLPWKQFCEFMDKHYDEFHQNPEKFMPEEPALDMANMQLPKPEATDMATEKKEGFSQRQKDIFKKAQNMVTKNAVIVDNYELLGLSPKLDKKLIIEIVKLAAKQNVLHVINSFKKFGLVQSKDKVSIVALANFFASIDVRNTIINFAKLGLTFENDKKDIVKIVKQYAYRNHADVALNFDQIGFVPDRDYKEIIEIAKICVENKSNITAECFDKFGLTPERDKKAIVELAKLSAKNAPSGTVQYFKNFKLRPNKDKEAIVEIAKTCMEENTEEALHHFEKFGLNHIKDKKEIIELALIAAEKEPVHTARYFGKFDLDIVKDFATIIKIAHVCYLRDGRAKMYFVSTVFSFKETTPIRAALKNIKNEDWPLIINSIGEETDYRLQQQDLSDIILSEKGKERTKAAMIIKQRIYRFFSQKKALEAYLIPLGKQKSYTGIYKLPWKEFCEFMDEHYDEFHQNPEKFMPKEPVIDISTMQLPKIEAPDMAEGVSDGDDSNPFIKQAIEDGQAVEVDEKNEQVKIIKRDRSNPRSKAFEKKLIKDKSFEKIAQAKQRKLLTSIVFDNAIDNNFRNLSREEAKRLIEIVQKTPFSFILGRVFIGKIGNKNKLVHVRSGYSKIVHGLDPTIWIGYELFKELSVEQIAQVLLEEAQHILKPPKHVDGAWIHLHGKISGADNPKEVIEHNSDLLQSLTTIGKNKEKVLGTKAQKIKKDVNIDNMNIDQVSAIIEEFVENKQGEDAEDVVFKAVQKGLEGVSLGSLGQWATKIGKVAPLSEQRIRNYQKKVLAMFLKNEQAMNNLFIYVNNRFSGICCGLGFEEFKEECLNILEDKKTEDKLSAKHQVFISHYLNRMMGIKKDLTEEEMDLIRNLSVEITRSIVDARKSGRLKNVGQISFREGMRFMKIFSRYYLQDMETAKSRIFEYFVLVAWSIYGRFINIEDREAFSEILVEIFNRGAYKSIFLEASVLSGTEVISNEALDIFDHGTFETQDTENMFPAERKILAAVERAKACNMPALFFTPAEYFPNIIFDSISSQEDTAIFPITMSGFTQRKEFFGMHIPDAENNVQWFSGAVKRIIDFAQDNPEKKVYFMLENPDFAAGDIRMALHQLLLERKITLEGETDNDGAKKGEISLPENVQLILTMESDSDVGDESFMDRTSGCFLEKPSNDQLKEYLLKKVGLPEEAILFLVDRLYMQIKQDQDVAQHINIQDIIQIGYYLAGRIKDNNFDDTIENIARQEAAMHLTAKFSPLQETDELAKMIKIVGEVPKATVKLLDDGKTISFNGIRIEIDPESKFGRFVAQKIEETKSVPDFQEVLHAFLPKEYFLTGIEEYIFCLLARVYKYSPSKVIFLQGLPGAGKTTIARVFLDVVGCNRQEYTLNKEADVSLFRGSLRMTKDGLEISEVEYWKRLSKGKSGVIINEADTRLKLLQWLWPNIIGRDFRHGWEFASRNELDPMGKMEFGNEGLLLLTGNVRKDIPSILSANMPASYFMERSEEDIYKITENMFYFGWKKLPKEMRKKIDTKLVKEKAKRLSEIYNTFVKEIRKDMFSSTREITPRQIERFRNLLFQNIEKGMDIEQAFNTLLYVVFVRMWDNEQDMRYARGVITTHVSDLSPPLSSNELIEFIRKFSLDIPVLILNNGTIDFEHIRNNVLSEHDDAKEKTIALSRFHTKKSLIGGMNPLSTDELPTNKLGILPALILEAHLDTRPTITWLMGYLNLNPQVAPLLNEFFQTKWLDVEEVIDENMISEVLEKVKETNTYERLKKEFENIAKHSLPVDIQQMKEEDKAKFARFLLGYKPTNLLFRAVGTAEEKINLHPADVDRFFVVNVSKSYEKKYLAEYVSSKLIGIGNDKLKDIAVKCVEEAFRQYEQQKEEELYNHVRLGIKDIEVFISEIKKRIKTGELDQKIVKLLGYHLLASGLTVQDENPEEGIQQRDYRLSFLKAIGLDTEDIVYQREFVKNKENVCFVISATFAGKKIEIARYVTRYQQVKKIDEYGKYACIVNGKEKIIRLQAPTQSLLFQQASQMIFSSHGMSITLEGDPGGGKTSAARDLAKATGRPYYEEGMFKWITLGALLGSLSIRGQKIVLNTLETDKNKRYMLPFLRMYSEGGTFVADEGMVSKGAEHLLRWIVEVNFLNEIDLGTYHPGLQGVVLKRHKDFNLVITQNEHFKTVGRRQIPWEVDYRTAKIHVNNVLSIEDAMMLIDYYLAGKKLDDHLKKDLAKLHLLFSRKHPNKRMISPRDLIDTIMIIADAAEQIDQDMLKVIIDESISINYLEGIVDINNRVIVEDLIKQIFPDFVRPDYDRVELPDYGVSNVDETEVTHLTESAMFLEKIKAVERMLEAGQRSVGDSLPPARQVLVQEQIGASGLDFVKLFCHLTGRALAIVEGHPYLTAKTLLVGESFDFEKEFDETGRKKAKPSFKQTHGIIRKYLIKAEDEQTIAEDKKVPTIVAVTNIEAIKKNELVKLNELIATRSIVLEDEQGKLCRFVLPNWITLIPITSDIDSLTSPFANRFRKIALPEISDASELWQVLSSQYPNISLDETSLLQEIAALAQQYAQEQHFEMSYGFTNAEINELALRLQMFKQKDAQDNIVKDDPFFYSLKAVYYVLLKAMCPEDAKIFTNAMIENILLQHIKDVDQKQMVKYLKQIFAEIKKQDRTIEHTNYIHKIDIHKVNEQSTKLSNGIIIQKNGDKLNIITDSAAYNVSWEQLIKNSSQEHVLSDELSVWIEDSTLCVSVKLIKQIGISDFAKDEENLKRALSQDEMSAEDFMYPAGSLVDSLNALLQAHTPVRTASGKIVRPRIVLMAGETGSGKTTIPRMFSKGEGSPLVRINPWKNMHASKLTVSLALGENVEMTVSEFLLSCGKINGKRINAAFPTSNRIRILIDEANVTSDVWYVLDAIARGEKSFRVETPAGEAVIVELDAEIEIVLTYNPPERYGGTGKGSNRFSFSQSLLAKTVKIYTSEPFEDYTEQEMKEIMKRLYQKGEVYFKRQKTLKDLGVEKKANKEQVGGFFNVEEEIFDVEKVQEPYKKTAEDIALYINNTFPSKTKKVKVDKEKIKEQIRRENDQYKFDPIIFNEALSQYEKIRKSISPQKLYIVFMNEILLMAIKGIASEKIGEEALAKVIEYASEIDVELGHIINDHNTLAKEEKIRETKVRAVMARLDRISRKNQVYLEGLNATAGRPFITYIALKINKFMDFDAKKLKEIIGENDFKRVFGDMLPQMLIVQRPMDGTLGYFDGKDMIITFLNDREKEHEVASHELGHFVSDKVGQYEPAIGERLYKNVEIFSMLFPLLLVQDPKQYVMKTLLERVNNRQEDDDAYALASMNILNAFCIEYALPRITMEFEQHSIADVVKKIQSLDNKEIFELAVKIWKDPSQYLPVVNKGVYYQRNIEVEGGKGVGKQTFSLAKGGAYRPRVKVVETIKMKSEQEDDDTEQEDKEFISDSEKERLNTFRGIERNLPETSRRWLKEYQKLFAPDDNGDDLEVRYVSEGGTDVNVEAWITGNADELLIAPQEEDEEKTLAQNIMFVIDVSGSIMSAPDLQDALESMLRHYGAFFLELSRKNPDLNIGIATISTKLTVLFDFVKWKQTKSHAARKKLIEDTVEEMWNTGDGGGIDSPAMIEGLSNIEFPANNAKDTKNLIAIFTDGQETGNAHGENLQKVLKDFSKGKHIKNDGQRQVQAKNKQNLDLAFLGIMLQDGGQALEENYPSFLNIEQESAENYFNALLKIAYMQAKKIPVEGNLRETMHDLGQKFNKQEQAKYETGYQDLLKNNAGLMPKPEATDMTDEDDDMGLNEKQIKTLSEARNMLENKIFLYQQECERKLERSLTSDEYKNLYLDPAQHRNIQYFIIEKYKNFNLDPVKDKKIIIEIAKLYAQEEGWGIAEHFKIFRLEPYKDKLEIIEIAKLCAKQNGNVTAEYFKNFGLDPDSDMPEILEIVMLCVNQKEARIAEHFKNFGLDPDKDKTKILEIAKLCAQKNGSNTAEFFQNFGFIRKKNKVEIVKIAKLCALKDGGATVKHFKNFGFYPVRDTAEKVEIAKLCAQQNGEDIAMFFQNFELDPDRVKAEIIEIAMFCANEEEARIAEFFQNFGLDPIEDKDAIVKIAKRCAQKDGWFTAMFFQNFGLDLVSDFAVFIEIAKICYSQELGVGWENFSNTGLQFKDRDSFIQALSKVKDADWPIILRETMQKYIPTHDDIKAVVFCATEEEQKKASIEIKQREYLETRNQRPETRNQRSLESISIPLEKLELYTGTYKLPWKEFCEFMDKNYDEFHQNPEKFIPEETEVDLSNMQMPKPEATDMADEDDDWEAGLNVKQRNALLKARELFEEKGSIIKEYENFGLDPIKDNKVVWEIVYLCAQQDMVEFAIYFHEKFGLDFNANKKKIVDLAYFLAKKDGWKAAMCFPNIGLDPVKNKKEIVEIAKFCAQEKGLNSKSMNMVELAKFCAKECGEVTAKCFKAFSLDYITNKQDIFDIVRLCIKGPKNIVGFFNNFQLDPIKDKAEIVEIAKICIEKQGFFSISEFKKFGLTRDKNKDEIVEIAKFSAKIYGGFVSLFFKQFGLDPIKDLEDIMDIAYLCYSNDPEEAIKNFTKFGISFTNDEDFIQAMNKIQGEDWSIILLEIEKGIKRDRLPSEDEYDHEDEEDEYTINLEMSERIDYWLSSNENMKKLAFAGTEKARSKIAIEIKQEIYREARSYKHLEEYQIDVDNVKLYTGIYKLPWDVFVRFMDKDYDEFHKNPEKFMPKDIEVDLSNMPLPKPEATDMASWQERNKKRKKRDEDDDRRKRNALAYEKSTINQHLYEVELNEFSSKVVKVKAFEFSANINLSVAIAWFDKFHLDPIRDKNEIVQIIKFCGEKNTSYTLKKFKKFGLDPVKNKKEIIETALFFAYKNGLLTAECFTIFEFDNLTDIKEILEIAKICAENSADYVVYNFKDFGFDPKTNKKEIFEVAKICFLKEPIVAIIHFQNFGLNISLDRNEILKLVEIASKIEGSYVAQYFKNFGLVANNEKDKQKVIEIAKLCAKQNGEGTAHYFKNFGLDTIKDMTDIIDIIYLSSLQNKEKVSAYFSGFGLPLDDSKLLVQALNTVKGEDWPRILEEIGYDINDYLTEKDMKTIAFSAPGIERTKVAIEIKQRIYRQRLNRKGLKKYLLKLFRRDVKPYTIPLKDIENYTGTYKLPWKQFCELMDNNFTEFHLHPEKFIPKDTEVDLLKRPLPKTEANDMAVEKENSVEVFYPKELAIKYKERIFSEVFDKRVVFVFDKDIAGTQESAPMKRLIEMLEEMKDDPVYKRLLANFLVLRSSVNKMDRKLDKYLQDKHTAVYVFAKGTDQTMEKLGNLSSKAKMIYLKENGIRSRAYYPIAEVAILSLMLIANEENLDPKYNRFAEVNIGDITEKDGALIFTFLDDAKEYDKGELLKKYAAMRKFLVSA